MSMILERSVITGKGQVQIPVKIRQAIDLNIGDEVTFRLVDGDKVEVEFIRKRPPDKDMLVWKMARWIFLM